jgi:4-amino-4-deoxy-L-arabinose transferase-like glycosyltransferase
MSRLSKQNLYYFLTAIIFVGGFVYWQSDLTSDPPMYYEGLGQSLSADPAQYIHHARNKVLFGEFDPFDYPRWTVYQHSLTSLVAYLWFTIAGVSMRQANFVGVLLSLGGLLFLILGLARHHRPWVTTAVAFCYIMNVTLFTYGRLSYLENGLIFLAAIVFFVYTRWGDRGWGAALTGGLVALAMLTGKLFGALILPALILTILFSGRPRRLMHAGAAFGGFLLMSLVTIILLYGQVLRAAVGYVGEQSLGLWGFPKGLTSPWAFFEHLISYGYENHLYFLDIDLALFLFAGLLLLSLYIRRENKLPTLPPTVAFPTLWAVIGILGLMPLNYSPLRYALLVIPPMIILCMALFDKFLDEKSIAIEKLGRVQTAILMFAFWMALFHSVANIFYLQAFPRPIRAITWATLPGGIAMAFAARYFVARRRVAISRRALTVVLGVLVCFCAVFNGYQIYRKHVREHNFNIAEANLDLQQILGPGAVVSGPYAPALTVDTDLRTFIHLFSVVKVDSTLFDRYPVTHVACDNFNWAEAVKNYPVLEGLQPTTTYWIRDLDVRIYNISKVFNNPEARAYQETEFERAVIYYQNEQYDSAGLWSLRFYKAHPESKSVGLFLSEVLWKAGRYNEVFNLLTSLANRFPTDFNVQLQCGRFLQVYAALKNDASLRSLAHRYYDQAVRVNRFRGGDAASSWLEIDRQIARGAQSGTP